MADDPKSQNTLENTRPKRHKITPEMEKNKWQKGIASPNPDGRPKTKPMTDELRRMLNRNVKGKPYTYLQLLVARAVKRALAGNDVMTKEVWNRIEGNPACGAEGR